MSVGPHQILHIYCLSLILIPPLSGHFCSQNSISGFVASFSNTFMFIYVNVCLDPSAIHSLLSYSCLKVILEILENLSKPDVNAWLHEFGFQVRATLSCILDFLNGKFLAFGLYLFSFIASRISKEVGLFLRKI